jgi:SAM-dependent methyltransferase
MEQAPTSSETSGSPVVYAGRFAGRVAELPAGCAALGDWDVLPARLAAELETATALIVLDLFSFPFESMTAEQWDVPLIVVLPEGYDAGFLEAVFGAPLFERLTCLDRIAAPEGSRAWEELRRRYRWTESQLIEVGDVSPEAAAAEICALLEAKSSVPTFFGGDGSYEALRYWSERGDALAESVPHRAICSVSHGARFNKAIHRVQRKALEPQFAAARGARAEDIPLHVLEVGAGVGRWATSFDLAKTRFCGVDVSEGMVSAARANFPEASFERLGPELGFPYEDESFDLVFTVTVMHHNPTPSKRTLLSEMWRVTRPGGRLLFLEDFVAGGWSERSNVYPMSVLEFVELLLEATAGQVVLEHVESVRYHHDDMTRGALLALTRLGVPGRW